ncbi:MAG: GatB/YqeY domain-containing protein [Candidatus Colwellbacteria bacterium]|nr:GatB/YqeY domain-containing protein [Candidatus Colwellbacteria bacterium]
MTLKDRITGDLKAALKGRAQEEVNVLRLMLAAIQTGEIAARSRSTEPLTDGEVRAILGREAKKRKEAIELYSRGGRDDLKAGEERELSAIEGYLPRQLSRDEVVREVEAALAHSGAATFSDAMKLAMPGLKGRADGRVVSDVVREVLGERG